MQHPHWVLEKGRSEPTGTITCHRERVAAEFSPMFIIHPSPTIYLRHIYTPVMLANFAAKKKKAGMVRAEFDVPSRHVVCERGRLFGQFSRALCTCDIPASSACR